MDNVIRLSPTWSQRLRLRLPLFDRCASRLVWLVTVASRLPPWCWPLLVALATWSSTLWSVERLLDEPDDALGIVAIGALLLMLRHARTRFARAPRIAPLAVASLLAITADLPMDGVPSLLRASMASLGIVVALSAIADRDEPIAPYAGLAILALPLQSLLSSRSFDAGSPWRIAVTEASRWLLTATGSTVARVGSALTVDGHPVLVDAVCGGVQMAWVGSFTACVVAWIFRVSDRAFVARLPFVCLAVLVGHIVRNTVLVAAAADDVRMTDAMHAAIGLVAFATVSAVIAALFVASRGPSVAFAGRDTRARPADEAGRSSLPSRDRDGSDADRGSTTARSACPPRPAAES